MTDEIVVAVPSKGHAGKVRTQKVLPSCQVFVPALEAQAYRRAGTKHVISVPDNVQGITRTRNWILRRIKSRRVVMIDDDVKTQGWIKLHERHTERLPLDETRWLGEFRKLFEITEQLHYRIFGVATDGAPHTCYPYFPFRFRSYVTASCMGIVNDGRTNFDESYPVKEDYELCCRCLKEDGGIVAAQYLHWVNDHWQQPGGCHAYRTQAMERDCIRRLVRTYPGLIRASERFGFGFNVEIVP